MHAKNTSQKVRTVLKNKGESGISLTNNVPYGYQKDESDKTKWIIDEQSAKVVREIYNLFIQGHGTFEIARILSERNIMTPAEYFASIGRTFPTRLQTFKHQWNATTIASILDRQEYIGDTVNFKYTVRSYKDKTKVVLPKEDWQIFKNTICLLLDRSTFPYSYNKYTSFLLEFVHNCSNIFSALIVFPVLTNSFAFSLVISISSISISVIITPSYYKILIIFFFKFLIR